MASSYRPPAAAPPPTPARALLAAFEPHLTLRCLQLSWRPMPRVAELRANALLLYRPDAPRDPVSASVHVALDAHTQIRHVSALAIRVAKHTLRFYAASDAHAFLLALQASISALSRAQHAAPTSRQPRKKERLSADRVADQSSAYELATLSNSAAATVTLVRQVDGTLHAHKAMHKDDALAPARLPHTIAERAALARLTAAGSPFFPRLHKAVETDTHLHLETEYASRGGLRRLLDAHPTGLPSETVRQLSAELVLALSDLHALDLLSRGVRTDNVMLSEGGHIRLLGLGLSTRVVLPHGAGLSRLADDGCLSDASGCFSAASTASTSTTTASRSVTSGRTHCRSRSASSTGSPIGSLLSELSESDAEDEEGPLSTTQLPPSVCERSITHKTVRGETNDRPPLARAKSFVGARHFMAPEMLRAGHGGDGSYGAKADVWALGLTLYELATGRHALADALALAQEEGDASGLYAAIMYRDVDLRAVADPKLRNMLQKMLHRDESLRVELNDVAEHAFFDGVNWSQLRLAASLDAPVQQVVSIAPRRFEQLPEISETTGRVSVERPTRRRRGSVENGEELLGFGFFVSQCAA